MAWEARIVAIPGKTEGGLSPHWLVFETIAQDSALQPGVRALAIGSAVTRSFQPEARNAIRLDRIPSPQIRSNEKWI